MAKTLVNLPTTTPTWTVQNLDSVTPRWSLNVLDTSTDWKLPGSWKSVVVNWEDETKTYEQIGLLGKDSD